jgi:hypothetical protein
MAKGKGFKAFEKSGADKEKKGEKEGGKADRARDQRQMAQAGFRRGGKVGKK